jgi:hypothetical protein
VIDGYLYWWHGQWVPWHRWWCMHHVLRANVHAQAVKRLKEWQRVGPFVLVRAWGHLLRAWGHFYLYRWHTWRLNYYRWECARHLDRMYVLAGHEAPERDPKTGQVIK